MKSILFLFFSILFSSALTFGQQPAPSDIKVASINLSEVLKKYSKANEELSLLQEEQKTYITRRKQREQAIQKLSLTIKDIVKKLENKAMPESEADNLGNQYKELMSQRAALLKDLQESDLGKNQELRAKFVTTKRTILTDLKSQLASYAKDHHYQWLIETSGKSNSRISPLIYAKHKTDITQEFIAFLKTKEDKQAKQQEIITP